MTISRSLSLIAALMLWLGASAGANARWTSLNHNFGAFSEDLGMVDCVFTAINTGNEPLQVLSARANCGCTVPEYDRQPIAPGDTLHLRVTYNPTGRPGRFDKKIYVYTNTDDDKYVLTIRGTVMGSQNTIKSRYPVPVEGMSINTTLLAMGEKIKGRSASSSLRCYNTTDSALVPVVENVPAYMKAEVRPPMVRPGEQFVISLTTYTDKCPEYGIVTDTILVKADAASDVSVPVTTIITIKEAFTDLTPEEQAKAPRAALSTEMIDFGRVSRKAGELRQSFTVTNSGGEAPLLIRRIYTPAKGVRVIQPKKFKPIPKGKSESFEVVFDPSQIELGEVLNARTTVITNDPVNPSQIIRLIAEPID